MRGSNKFLGNKKVADVIVESLIGAGVKRIYGISGDSLNGITDFIREHEKTFLGSTCPMRRPLRLLQAPKLMLQEILLSVQEAEVQEIHT